MKHVLFFFFFLAINFCLAETSVSGIVRDKENNPLGNVSVYISGTNIGTVTNAGGEYAIAGLEAGAYILEARYLGFEVFSQEINIQHGQPLKLDIVLTESAALLPESVISGLRASVYTTDTLSQGLRLQARLIEIPQNIVVIDKQVLKDQQIFNAVEGLGRNVSGVRRIAHWDNVSARLFVRGSQLAFGSFRNGMSMSNYVGPMMEDMSFVEKVEFVKGPGSFMLSNSEPGGFYNVVTKKPTGVKKYEFNLTSGSFWLFRGTADINGAIGKKKKLLYRLNGMAQHKKSWVDYDFNDKYVFAPSLKYMISEKTSVTAEYSFQFSKFQQTAPYAFSARGFKDLPVSFFGSNTALDPNKAIDHTAFVYFDHKFNGSWSLNAQFSTNAFRQRGQFLWPVSIDSAGNSINSYNVQDLNNESYLAQVFTNGTIKTGPVTQRVLAGIDAGRKTYLLAQPLLSVGFEKNIYHPVYDVQPGEIPVYDHNSPLEPRADYKGAYSYLGVYVQDEILFFKEKLRLTLGGRFTMTDKNSTYGMNAVPDKTQNKVVTPRIAISGSILSNLSIYALYDVAFVEQMGTDYYGKAFKPLTGRNIEGGVKGSFFRNKLSATVAYYNIIKNNALTADNERPGFLRQNGEITSQGVEIDVIGQVVNGLNIIVNYAYSDSKITDDTDPEVVGTQTPGTARHIANGWISYQLTRTKLRGLGASFGYQYQAKRFMDMEGIEKNQVLPDNYLRFDAGLSWTNGRINCALLVNNLANAYLYSGNVSNSRGYTLYQWQTEAPRSFRISVGYKF